MKGLHMTKRLIATMLAASIAMTGLSSVPARAADSGEIARLIFGAGAILLLGNELSKQNRNNNRYDDRDVTRRYVDPAPHVVHRRNILPSACLRVNQWDNGQLRSTQCGITCIHGNRHTSKSLRP